jgi:hypothetical protein
MSKTNGAAVKVPTHFETVPLAVVKEIAVADPPMDQRIVVPEIDVPPGRGPVIPVPTPTPAGKKR